ncbi:MAG: replication initiation protein RepC [Akkermansiaceae bacterium]
MNQVVNASSSRFREHLPPTNRSTSEHDLVEAAYQMREQLQISKGSWSRACNAMGRMGAAICLLLTDQAALRQVQPVRVPGAYFNAMVTRSQKGELHLKRSIFAQLKREEGALA